MKNNNQKHVFEFHIIFVIKNIKFYRICKFLIQFFIKHKKKKLNYGRNEHAPLSMKHTRWCAQKNRRHRSWGNVGCRLIIIILRSEALFVLVLAMRLHPLVSLNFIWFSPSLTPLRSTVQLFSYILIFCPAWYFRYASCSVERHCQGGDLTPSDKIDYRNTASRRPSLTAHDQGLAGWIVR